MKIEYYKYFDYWLRENGFTVLEQCNHTEYISFHSWPDLDSLLETPTAYTVAIWTVKQNPAVTGLNDITTNKTQNYGN